MRISFRAHCTARIEGSYECNCDSLKMCVLNNAAPFVSRDGLGLPWISASDDLEPFVLDGEVLMRGNMKFSFRAATMENILKIVDVFTMWAVHFGSKELNFQIVGSFDED